MGSYLCIYMHSEVRLEVQYARYEGWFSELAVGGFCSIRPANLDASITSSGEQSKTIFCNTRRRHQSVPSYEV